MTKNNRFFESPDAFKASGQFSTINRVSATTNQDTRKEVRQRCPFPVIARPSYLGLNNIAYVQDGDKEIPCNKWSCPVCSVRLRKSWRWWMWHKFSIDNMNGKKLAFFTLTIDPKRIPAGVEFNHYMQDTWHRFNALLFKRKVDMKFVSIIEPHLKGNYHMHLIASFNSEFEGNQDMMRALWYKAGGGCEVIFSFLKNNTDEQLRRSIGYVSKYMTKDLADLPKAIKASQGYGIHSKVYKLFVKSKINKKTLDKKEEYIIYSLLSGRKVERLVSRKKERRKYKTTDVKSGTVIFQKYNDVLQVWESNYKKKMEMGHV